MALRQDSLIQEWPVRDLLTVETLHPVGNTDGLQNGKILQTPRNSPKGKERNTEIKETPEIIAAQQND